MDQLLAAAILSVNTQTRAAQDSMQMYICLQDSLSEVGRNKVTLLKSEYTAGGDDRVISGILFLKTIVRESHIDTNATVTTIRKQSINLPRYMLEVICHVEKLNLHTQLLLEALCAQGETTNDLLNNLFRAYKTVKDQEFLILYQKWLEWRLWRLAEKYWNSTRTTPFDYTSGIIPQVLAFELIVAYQAYDSAMQLATDAHTFIVDSNSRPLGIDNRASAFISGDVTDFKQRPAP
jgi:hypothetical protein